ncbi:WD repeat-containing protein slp1 [Malassezia brasiliensis]|uniref:WD repeat-containing protein slp1 n=1 Tax=Malassezia brasiliensis TaxID=1821822 RepID=A0AAF0DWP9_9BASI|nr:WD repeat-containing protein slp1 [Malassezia brasiliensis]
MGPSTPTRSKGSTAALTRSMASMGLDSPLADVSANVRQARMNTSPIRAKPTKLAAPKPRREKEDMVPVGLEETRGVVSKDWDGPDVALGRRRSAASVSVQRGDRYIPNRELSRATGSTSQPFLEDGAGESLATMQRVERSDSISSSASSLADVDTHTGLEEVCHVERGQRILSFSAAPPSGMSSNKDIRSRYATKKSTLPSSLMAAGRRRIPTAPERVLDAPAIVPDFYYNLLHWSTQNVIAIALQSAVHTWNSETGEANFLLDLEEESERVGGGGLVTSLRWDADGNILAVGTDRGYTQIWDVNRGARLRTLRPDPNGGADASTINALAWAPDGTLNVGYASGLIREHDVRQRDSITRSLERAHAAQVCGLAWRADSALLASGGNDNVVKVWDRRTSVAKMRKENHNAAVKALAWSPHNSSLLATGGGSADRCIHFWNTTQNTRVQTIQTNAQITSLQWAPHYREIVSSHGVSNAESNEGALCVWAHPSGQKVAEVPAAHDGRILHTSLSPDGQCLATVGSDESLKFWRVFEQPTELSKGTTQRGILGSSYKGMMSAARPGAASGAAAPRSLR